MELRGVRVHNLKNLDLDIPLNRLVVVSGVSGSGKSSLAFETVFAEGQRRYIESVSITARQHLERIERPNADRIAHVPVALAIRTEQGPRTRFDARSTVAAVAGLLDGLRLLFARTGQIVCLQCGHEVRSNSASDVVRAISALPSGKRCQIGFTPPDTEANPGSLWLVKGYSRAIWGGVSHDLSAKPAWPVSDEVWIVVDRVVVGRVAETRLMENAEASLREGAGRCWILFESEESTDHVHDIDGRKWQLRRFSRRMECDVCGRQYLPVEPRLFSPLASGACPACRGTGRQTSIESGTTFCSTCHGSRLREEARAVKIADSSIADLCKGTSADVLSFVRNLRNRFAPDILRLSERILQEIEHRLNIVCEMGLDYLPLDRSSESLSSGEIRRLMLAAVIGSRITGTLVVVDEPSAGLAVSEWPRVVAGLRRLQSLGNSVVAVDHAPLLVSSADHVIELGPEAGPQGGHIVYQGPPQRSTSMNALSAAKAGPSVAPVTDQIPSRQPVIQTRGKKRTRKLSLDNVHYRNFAKASFEFPLNQLCVITGPSGSGKTSLLIEIVYPAVCDRLGISCSVPSCGKFDFAGGEGLVDVAVVDQSPLTRSSRSNPATWLEVFDEIRQTFASTLDARQHGYTARHFSFNSPSGGRCQSCQGTGVLKQDMQFLADVTLACPECRGSRYGSEILEVKYRGRSIADVLAMSVSEAATFFRSQPRVQNRFQFLKQIGLDYLVLGQPSETLSGGEAQRLKLAARIALPNRGPALILCDEPTTGLHPRDVGRLVDGFRELIANGHSLILADNSPELLATADSVIELRRS